MTRTGLTLSGDPVLFATNAEDYNPVASKIKAQNPDAVWMAIGIDPSFFGIVKGLRTLGYQAPSPSRSTLRRWSALLPMQRRASSAS